MFGIGRIKEFFKSSVSTEAPQDEYLTPLDLPPLSDDDTPPTEFEKRRSIQRFHEICTQELVEEAADDLFIRKLRYSHSFRLLTDLWADFENSPDEEHSNFVDGLFSQAFRRRDADFLNGIADESFEPYSQQNNPAFVEKVRALTNGTAKAALRVV